jgi:hypothetical protein
LDVLQVRVLRARGIEGRHILRAIHGGRRSGGSGPPKSAEAAAMRRRALLAVVERDAAAVPTALLELFLRGDAAIREIASRAVARGSSGTVALVAAIAGAAGVPSPPSPTGRTDDVPFDVLLLAAAQAPEAWTRVLTMRVEAEHRPRRLLDADFQKAWAAAVGRAHRGDLGPLGDHADAGLGSFGGLVVQKPLVDALLSGDAARRNAAAALVCRIIRGDGATSPADSSVALLGIATAVHVLAPDRAAHVTDELAAAWLVPWAKRRLGDAGLVVALASQVPPPTGLSLLTTGGWGVHDPCRVVIAHWARTVPGFLDTAHELGDLRVVRVLDAISRYLEPDEAATFIDPILAALPDDRLAAVLGFCLATDDAPIRVMASSLQVRLLRAARGVEPARRTLGRALDRLERLSASSDEEAAHHAAWLLERYRSDWFAKEGSPRSELGPSRDEPGGPQH